MDFIIDPEFKSRCRELTGQERQNLELRIEEDGPRADSVWVGLIGSQKILIDGHNTVSICREKGIPIPAPRVKQFSTREEALEWMEHVQRSRRNLSLEEMLENAQQRRERIARRRSEGASIRQIAAEEGVSLGTIQRDIEASGVSPDTPALKPKRTRGRDNKTYRSSRSKSKPKPKSALAEGEVPPETQCCTTCKGTGRIPKVMYGELFAAIVKVTGCDSKVNGSWVGKVTKLLLGADPPYTPAEVMKLPGLIKRVWPKVLVSVGVVEKYIAWTRNGPPTSESELERLRREVGA